jgi:hypothetical protein
MTARTGTVGIIANPASGKDIRRLVAHGSVFDNNEKINIVRRILTALAPLGISDVWYMPDTYAIVERAAHQARAAVDLHALPMPVYGHSSDSTEAAMRLRDLGVSCIVTLGGDGTNRVVAKGAGDVPLIPISTGTNNVFPEMVEGTLAGMAAAAVAHGIATDAIDRRPILTITVEGEARDIALVDVVVSNQPWVGSRAFWQADHIVEVVLSHTPARAIGISSLGPLLFPGTDQSLGLHARLGTSGTKTLCPIAPGLLCTLTIAERRQLQPGGTVRLSPVRGTLALDGEREIELRGDEHVDVTLDPDGPVVVDFDRAIDAAVVSGLFHPRPPA